jgi:hypothetical protein
MKAQDQYPYDKAIVGLNNLYVVDNKGNVYINSPCIMVEEKTVATGNNYLLIVHPTDKKCIIYAVRLLDVYFDDGIVNLIVCDLLTQRIFKINQCIECTEARCKWILAELDYLNKLIDYKTILSYCGKS